MTLRASPHPASWPPGVWLPGGRLLLWLAAALFALQVGVHAAMPAGATMPQMFAGLPSAEAPHPGTNPAMDMAAMHPDAPLPLHPKAEGSTRNLCCMPPLALVPLLWAPVPLLPARLRLPPPRAVREALRILRATARGPPNLTE